MSAKCKTCGGENGKHKPSMLDRFGIGHADHVDPADVQQVADKVEGLIAMSAFLIDDIPMIEQVNKQAINISSHVATIAPILGAVGMDWEQKQLEADVRRERAAAILNLAKVLRDTEKKRQEFYEKQEAKAAARAQLSASMGGL